MMSIQVGCKLLAEVGENGIKILFLLIGGRSKLSGVKSSLNMGSAGVYNAIAVLLEHGLIRDYHEGASRYFELTEKGRRIAEKIAEADKIFNEP